MTGPVTHEQLAERLDKGDRRFGAIEEKLDALIESVDKLTATVEPIKDDISVIKEMTSGWRAVGTIGKFAKWVGSIATALAAIWLILKVSARALVQ